MLPLIGLTIFVSAFLLFCCEPMIGKMVLPILGGAASVWTACVLFFQTMLLAGYVYTHALRRLAVRRQILVHSALMIAALLFLPVRLSALSGNSPDAPVRWLFGHLLLSAGIPFAVISATAPLLQNWLSGTAAVTGRDPYFLYAVSNAGSLGALIAYPVVFEPRFGVSVQSRYWFYGYGLLLAFMIVLAVFVWRNASVATNDAVPSQAGRSPSWRTRIFWLAASFVPSALMLAVTNHLTLNIAPAPLLWVIPLAVYLLTYIMAFARRLRQRTVTVSTIATIVLLVFFPLAASGVPIHTASIWTLMACHLLILFFGALLCHSSLADSRPPTQYLTEFYFLLALGGVLGGIFTSIVAPAIFRTVLEYPLLVAVLMFFRMPPGQQRSRPADAVWIAAYALLVDGAIRMLNWLKVDAASFTLSWHWKEISPDDVIVATTGLALLLTLIRFRKRRMVFAAGFAAFVMALAIELPRQYETTAIVHIDRNFFGVKKVLFDAGDNARKLLHGDTLHGLESLDPALRGEPLFYYYRGGAFSDVMHTFDGRRNLRVAVVGLGTGTIAAYATAERHITFIDIDPQMVDIARNYFTFLERCGTNCDVVVGDGRLSLEARSEADYDLIVLDAFNSDSIPAHLISREAVRSFRSKLRDGGALLFHVSNRYLDVGKLAAAVSIDEGLRAFRRADDDYIVAVRNPADLDAIAHKDQWNELTRSADLRAWTDDYSNVVSLIRWN